MPELRKFPCRACGAPIEFQPGANALTCPFCGGQTPIPQSEADIEELDFSAWLEKNSATHETQENQTIRCAACGAEASLAPDIASDVCPFCGANLVAEGGSRKAIKPKSLLPFRVTSDQARAAFGDWLRHRWFLPNAVRKFGREGGLTGIYVPYWTYDCQTTSFYRGERGDDYWVTETYTTMENGHSVTKTRQVQKTRWTPVSGTVWNGFDDILVLASASMPRKYVERLEPWDLTSLVPYANEYLSGFRTESYQVELADGFKTAQEIMAPTIEETICQDIGGDHQRVHAARTQYNRITFKHILLPVWVSAYRYGDKVYRFLVNARTGEVQGDRPWSWTKILLALAGLAATTALLLVLSGR